jgi:uncharacterized membrane protein (UPF0127 family)
MITRIAKLLVFVFFCYATILFTGLLTGCSSDKTSKDYISASFVDSNSAELVNVTLEVASTAAQRSLGLMYRDSLELNHGMIFLFPDEKVQSFWMKNTKIPLDIIFLDSAMKVVAIQYDAAPYSEAPRDSKGKPSKFVVELVAGSCVKYGVSEGSTLMIKDGQLLPNAQ